jgi:hypothetical protein
MPSLDTMMSYHRLKRAPLDDSEVFSSVEKLMDYCDTGACYNGQRVSVYDRNNIVVEYTIKKYNERYYPIINTKGSELIFKYDEYNNEYWLLVYEYNSKSGSEWRKNEVFSFDEEKLCLISQLEIFRLFDNEKYFELMITRQERNGTDISIDTWIQNVNPYSGNIGDNKGISYSKYPSGGSTIKYNNILNMNYNDSNNPMLLMPYDDWLIKYRRENDFITKIYIKANDYYNALNNIEKDVS